MKKIPQRMCVVCRSLKPKAELIRVVKTTDDTYVLDETGKLNGRGAYVCKSASCLEKCTKTKALNKAFKHNISNEIYSDIKENCIEQ